MHLSRRSLPLACLVVAVLAVVGCSSPSSAPATPGAAPAPPPGAPAPPAMDPDPTDPGQVWLSEDQRLYYYPPDEGLTVGYLGQITADGMSSIVAHNATVLDVSFNDDGETVTAREQTVYSMDIDGEFLNVPMETTLSFLTEPDGTLRLPANRFMGAGTYTSGDSWVTIPGPERLASGPYRDTAHFTMNTGGDTSLTITLDYTVTSSGWLGERHLAVTMRATGTTVLSDSSGSDGFDEPMQITVDWVFEPGYGVISEAITTVGDGVNSSGMIEHTDYTADLDEYFR